MFGGWNKCRRLLIRFILDGLWKFVGLAGASLYGMISDVAIWSAGLVIYVHTFFKESLERGLEFS